MCRYNGDWLCHLCNKRFISPVYLRTHMYNHTGGHKCVLTVVKYTMLHPGWSVTYHLFTVPWIHMYVAVAVSLSLDINMFTQAIKTSIANPYMKIL